mgnify:CR=1 FL=1
MADRTVIVGGGASGLVAAIAAASMGDSVLVLERQSRPGKKLLATGNGRCNLMNLSPPKYFGDSEFALAALAACPPERIERFWRELGLGLRQDGEGRVYPCTFQAATVLETLMLSLDRHHIQLENGADVVSARRQGPLFSLRLRDDRTLDAHRLIICCGGPAQPRLGGTDAGYGLLTGFGHRLIDPSPSLPPLETDRRSVSGLAGIRVKCEICLENDGVVVRRETGELLFTEDGISGICVMQCARFATPGKSICEMNLIEDLTPEMESAVAELRERKNRFPEEDPIILIQGFCLPKMAFAVCKQAGLALRGERNADLQESDLRAIVRALTAYRVKVTGRKGFEQAQVSAGGLECGAFRPENLESKLVSGLHATGEMLNVDGDCGGYNLMFAWATGILAGTNGRSSAC